MECLKWQEIGLLAVSGEADAGQKDEFAQHMKICAACKDEADAYLADKKNFFSSDLLAEAPSETIDAKIIAACSSKPLATGIGLFSGLWVKKAVFSTLLLVFGMGAGAYFATHYFAPNNSVAASKPAPNTVPAQAMQGKAPADSVSAKKDSLKTHNAVFPSGQKSSDGIITVGVKKE
jgi:hypothetical protein